MTDTFITLRKRIVSMFRKQKILIVVILMLITPAISSTRINSSHLLDSIIYTVPQKSNSVNFPIKITMENYTWIWETYQRASGAIPGDDIVFWGEDMGPYHNYTEVTTKLHSLESLLPEIVDVFTIGQSTQGRELWTIRITNETVTDSKTEYYMVGAHHAREAISVENCLYFVDRVINETISGNQTIIDILNTTEIYVIPLLNPDGHSILWWYPWMRKNMGVYDDDHDQTTMDEFEAMSIWDSDLNISITVEIDSEDADTDTWEDAPGGVDLNRNYDFQWYGIGSSSSRRSDLFRGPISNSEVETQAMIQFSWEHDFHYALSIHSGIEAVIMPWGFDLDIIPPHVDELNATLNVLKNITAFPSWIEAGGYVVNGEWGDWMLARRDILPLTLETYEDVSASYMWDYYNPPAN
ncbi:MAG: M14 family zinc carboxypeptidase, partial [Candidatus Heimdallarchaeaceae archaeon]